MPAIIPSAKNVHALEALMRKRGFGETLHRSDRKARHPPVPSGIEPLDTQLGGGLPRGSISEVTGRGSSGRTGLVLGALALATQEGEVAAYVDATDCLDPPSAEAAGVALEQLLWIRCAESSDLRRSSEAWQAANLVVAAGAFGLVAIDLGGLSQRQLGRWQRRPWIRLKRAIEGTRTAVVVLAERHLAGTAADLVLELRRERTEWGGLLGGIGIGADVVKDKLRAGKGRARGRAA